MADWSLVLEAAGIAHMRTLGVDGWRLRVGPLDVARARQALDAYDQETATRRMEQLAGRGWVEPYGRSSIGVLISLALMLFFGITGPSDQISRWSVLGSSASERILHGELWRTVTALTLHADPSHLLGNVLACLVFITLLGNRLGPGLASWLVLLAGALGNLLTAVLIGRHHVAVGASTATFGALGGLLGLWVKPPSRFVSAHPAWTALAATGALFAMLGTGPGVDVPAHFFGLLSGVVLGAAFVLAGAPLRNRWVQGSLAFAAALAVAVCWGLAFSRGQPV